MAYIGRGIENLINAQKLDAITPSTATGVGPYNLTQNSVAFVPASADALVVSINGVVQYGNFTVSGSTITFSGALTDADTCDFIYQMGTGLLNTPADGTVNTAQLADGGVTNVKLGTDISASKITTGTLPDARITGAYTGITNLTMSGNLTVDTDTLFVDASADKVGIGTATPDDTLHVNSGGQNDVAKFESTDTTASLILVDSATTTDGNRIQTIGNTMNFQTGGSEAMRINASQQIGIGTASPSQALDVVGSIEVSDGIYIGGTGTANKLDDYEEGTWTPAFANAPSATFGTNGQQGYYTKVGRLVTVGFNLSISGLGGGSGGADIIGLPFAASNASPNSYYAGTIMGDDNWSTNLSGNNTILNIYGHYLNTRIFLQKNNCSNIAAIQLADIGTSRVVGTITYFTDA